MRFFKHYRFAHNSRLVLRHPSQDAIAGEPTTDGFLTVRGFLHLRSAILAARSGQAQASDGYLDEAAGCARHLPGVFDLYDTAFCAANVQIHSVAAAVELGDGTTAVGRDRPLPPGTDELVELAPVEGTAAVSCPHIACWEMVVEDESGRSAVGAASLPAVASPVEDAATAQLAVDRRIAVSSLLTGRDLRVPLLHHAWGPRRLIRSVLRRPRSCGADDAAEPLVAAFRRHHPDATREEVGWLRGCYRVAAYLHGEQRRKTGAPYITHPLAVAAILAEMGMDMVTLVAALLHDTVEDTDYTLGECRADFGAEVAQLVDGVTKLDGKRLGKDVAERSTYAKMVLAAGADLRVLLIKLVDRLHNLRTLGGQPPPKRVRVAQQSMDLLVPFCDRLGLYRLKREMEDLAFRYLHPVEYDATIAAVTASAAARDRFFGEVTEQIAAAVRGYGLRAEVTARPRHLYSIYQAGSGGAAGFTPGRVCRVVVVVEGADPDCWVALGAVHRRFAPIPDRQRDYLASPKFNAYRSLHTSVIGDDGERLDVMIRTHQMDRMAEDGIAATIRDTSGQDAGSEHARHRQDLEWLRRLLAWQDQVPAEDYLDDLRAELRGGSIVVIAEASGEFITLPSGATGVDFAFARGFGNRTVSLRINGQFVRVTAPLHNGDLVSEITAKKDTAIPADWWPAAHTAHARRGLRAAGNLYAEEEDGPHPSRPP